MTAEKPPGPRAPSPLGEVKLMREHRLLDELKDCKEEVTHYCKDTTSEEDAAVTYSEEHFCRICHEGRVSGELLSPCGSLAMVHQACLEHWLTASNSSHCEVCHHQFALERLSKSLTEDMEEDRPASVASDSLAFSHLT